MEVWKMKLITQLFVQPEVKSLAFLFVNMFSTSKLLGTWDTRTQENFEALGLKENETSISVCKKCGSGSWRPVVDWPSTSVSVCMCMERMCVCVCVYKCVFVRSSMTGLNICINIWMNIWPHSYVLLHTYTVYVCVCVCVYFFLCVYSFRRHSVPVCSVWPPVVLVVSMYKLYNIHICLTGRLYLGLWQTDWCYYSHSPHPFFLCTKLLFREKYFSKYTTSWPFIRYTKLTLSLIQQSWRL